VSTTISTQHGEDAGVIDLARGDPGRDLLPAALVRDAADRATAALDPDLLQYGLESGDAGVRAAVSAFLEREGAGVVPPERLFLTAGASLALHLICTLFTRPGDRVLVAEPTYHLALAQFRDHGLRVEGVASDADGLVPDALEAALRAGPVALLYLVPAFANPTGATLPPERQAAVVALAARYGVRVVADEVYRLTGFGPPASADAAPDLPPRSLAALDGERVLALNSVSKVLSPGLRLGWIDGPPADLQRIATSGVLRSGGGMNPFPAAVVRAAIDGGGLAEHVARVRVLLRERHAALAGALKAELPQAVFSPATGGYFLWVRVPGLDVDAAETRAALHRHAVRVAPGTLFSPPPAAGVGHARAADAGSGREHMRLCFAHARPEALREGVARLAAALEDVGA
jgi:DNA-binding transcriptional MocR family regulator